MKKQRREDYTPLAIMETTFILGPRFKSLPISARCLYVALWCRAYQCRRGHLPGWYDLHAMRDDSRLDTRTIRKALATLQQHCLILYHADGTISVPGVHEKGRIRWKDSPQDFPENVKFDPAESTIGVNKAGAESHLESESKTESKLESGGARPFSEKGASAPPISGVGANGQPDEGLASAPPRRRSRPRPADIERWSEDHVPESVQKYAGIRAQTREKR